VLSRVDGVFSFFGLPNTAFPGGGITCSVPLSETKLTVRSITLKTFNPESMTLHHPATHRGIILIIVKVK
jgi:hypothetical protein